MNTIKPTSERFNLTSTSYSLKQFHFAAICLLLLACKNDLQNQVTPEPSRFTKTELVNNLNEPMELAVLPSGNVLFIERKGAIKLFDATTKQTTTLTTLPVFSDLEDGLLGLTLDPDFSENNFIYLYYSPVGEKEVQRISRFSFKNKHLDLTTEKVVIEIPVQRKECCHSAGSITFGPDKTLYIAVGDNTNPHNPGYYNSIDERAGREYWDSQRTAGNTNDLRGKILRIKPLPEGGYTIPAGNLFPKDSKTSRPEIYAMGCRNPYRIHVDQQTGYLYWGDVGQNTELNPARGPISYDEFHQAKGPGFFGWPYFAGNNQPYTDFDFETNVNGAFYDSLKPVNLSRNNTGDTVLPPAQPAFIWYSYAEDSSRFQHLGSGGKSPIAGPVYYMPTNHHPNALPEYYSGKWFIAEWMRDWINVVSMDAQGKLKSIERFMPGTAFDHPIDLEFSADGRLYILEYGPFWFSANATARLSLVEYNPGNRTPVIVLETDKREGATPLTVNLSAARSYDYDSLDKLSFLWLINTETKSGKEITHTFTEAGEHPIQLTVRDEHGASQTKTIIVRAGNERPEISISLKGNQTFFWPDKKVEYAVSVTDAEDKVIDAKMVTVNLEPVDIGLGQKFIASLQMQDEVPAALSNGENLIAASDCKACHHATKKSVGPTYTALVQRYPNSEETVHLLANKIIKGGSGNWGETAMSAHPQFSQSDAEEIVHYLFENFGANKKNQLPMQGTFQPNVTEREYLVSASYTDKGNNAAKAITQTTYRLLRWPELYVSNYDAGQSVSNLNDGEIRITQSGGYLKFNQLDLTDVHHVTYTLIAPARGTLELRLDSPTGPVAATINLESIEVKPRSWGSGSAAVQATGLHDCYFVLKAVEPNVVDLVGIRFGSSKLN